NGRRAALFTFMQREIPHIIFRKWPVRITGPRLFLVSSAWAPRCPTETCRSRYEQQHADLVSGLFSPSFVVAYKMHCLWDKDRGESNPNTDFVPDASNGGKKKARKRYPWERW